MTIQANQVTLIRMLLLPIPCYLMFGNLAEKIAALFIFTSLGLTDYFDGILARKQGPTTLGALMDPIADKIFITAIYIPLARMEIVPLWMVLLLFIREYTIMEFRSIFASSGIPFETSELAKYKTTIQMMGGGFIFIIELFGESRLVLVPLGGAFLLAATPGVLSWIRSRTMGTRSKTAIFLVGLVLLFRIVLPPQWAIWAIMASITVVTLASGIQYIQKGWDPLRAFLAKRFHAREWTSFIGISLAFPVLYVTLSHVRSLWTWMFILILAIEFAIGGLNNLLTVLKVHREYITGLNRTLVQVVVGASSLVLLWLALPELEAIVEFLLWVVLTLTLLYGLRHFYIHRAHFLTP